MRQNAAQRTKLGALRENAEQWKVMALCGFAKKTDVKIRFGHGKKTKYGFLIDMFALMHVDLVMR